MRLNTTDGGFTVVPEVQLGVSWGGNVTVRGGGAKILFDKNCHKSCFFLFLRRGEWGQKSCIGRGLLWTMDAIRNQAQFSWCDSLNLILLGYSSQEKKIMLSI